MHRRFLWPVHWLLPMALLLGLSFAARLRPADPALASLCHVLLNANEFLYVD